ncbi:MAG: hypothetical protein K2M31_02175 [Muribaculaceae bacterium]|nr:hypothetical protein [Muribaculaceae bacterium]
MKPSRLYIIITAAVFIALAVVFLCLPRSVYSELEKRELAVFPEFKPEKLKGAQYPQEVSHWFSDTEPYRDKFMLFSMAVRDKLKMNFGSDEDAVTFHSTESGSVPGPAADANPEEIADYKNKINANDNAKIASAGIIIVGKEPNVRALNAFGGEATGGTAHAAAVSQYAAELPGVNVYTMIIPLSSEFYMPDKAKDRSKPQLPFIRNIYSHLKNGAKGVNAYTALAEHAEEDIYLRTDHHWAPLGAYYAAKAFANAAGVPFKDLTSYEKKTIHGYVGSMYGYSKDISIKNSPEDFIFYVPKGLNPQTTYRDYKVNSNYQVVSEGPAVKGDFFYKYPDGNPGAYCTYMGSDKRLTHIHTGSSTGRRLVIIKDSYGNPVPSFLFYSFDDIYVVDFRYFSRNIKKFCADNKVTDLVFVMNVFNGYSSSAAEKVKKFLSQGDGTFASATPTPEKKPAGNTQNVEASKKPAAKDAAPATATSPAENVKPAAKAESAPELKPESKSESEPKGERKTAEE